MRLASFFLSDSYDTAIRTRGSRATGRTIILNSSTRAAAPRKPLANVFQLLALSLSLFPSALFQDCRTGRAGTTRPYPRHQIAINPFAAPCASQCISLSLFLSSLPRRLFPVFSRYIQRERERENDKETTQVPPFYSPKNSSNRDVYYGAVVTGSEKLTKPSAVISDVKINF
ncbi:hypothetical protein PUN28_019879 [Cardiocondyla obscurior]|uniref:Uncharacterized protein n=1 Tax=Cardiocondyla obscurior TaxID=286306 RepID=A0AAW2EBZ9_9HYME